MGQSSNHVVAVRDPARRLRARRPRHPTPHGGADPRHCAANAVSANVRICPMRALGMCRSRAPARRLTRQLGTGTTECPGSRSYGWAEVCVSGGVGVPRYLTCGVTSRRGSARPPVLVMAQLRWGADHRAKGLPTEGGGCAPTPRRNVGPGGADHSGCTSEGAATGTPGAGSATLSSSGGLGTAERSSSPEASPDVFEGVVKVDGDRGLWVRSADAERRPF